MIPKAAAPINHSLFAEGLPQQLLRFPPQAILRNFSRLTTEMPWQ